MHETWTVLLAELSFCAAITAQAACTATATQALVATSTVTGTQTFPAGPVPSGGITVSTQGLTSVWSRIDLSQHSPPSVPPGAAGWIVHGEVNVAFGFPGGVGTASLSGQVVLNFSSPQPVAGLLYMRPHFMHSPQFQTFSGDLTVDVDGDGVPDYAASTRHPEQVEMPVTLDSTGTALRVDLGMSGSWSYFGVNNVHGHTTASWEIVFLPGTFGLERHGSGCVPIEFGRWSQNGWKAGIGCSLPGSATPIAAGFMLLGLGEQNAPLPLPPFCPLLVASPAVVMPDWCYSQSIGFFAPDLLVPSGVRFYCQAIWIDVQGQVVTSDSIRTM